MDSDVSKTNNVLEVKDFSFSYDGGNSWTLKNINLEIEDLPKVGEFIIFMGPSGCGKSTLLHAIAGTTKPSRKIVTKGSINIRGEAPENVVSPVVFQKSSFFPWLTVLENIKYPFRIHPIPRKEAHDRAMEMVNFLGLHGHEDKYPDQLSGGQQQRVALARSLVIKPHLLPMDEAFTGLDPNTKIDSWIFLDKLWKDIQSTIIFITHDSKEAVFLGDKVYVFSNEGTISDVIDIDLPAYDRTESIISTPRFMELENDVWRKVREVGSAQNKTK